MTKNDEGAPEVFWPNRNDLLERLKAIEPGQVIEQEFHPLVCDEFVGKRFTGGGVVTGLVLRISDFASQRPGGRGLTIQLHYLIGEYIQAIIPDSAPELRQAAHAHWEQVQAQMRGG